MTVMKKLLIVSCILFITACSRSKDINWYVLKPIPAKSHTDSKQYPHLQIGIRKLNVPEYVEKKAINVFLSERQLKLEDDHQWVGQLKSNIEKVIRTNLSTLLPGAVIQISPWDNIFKPNYKLLINVSEFEVTTSGQSTLRAEYLIYRNNHLIRKKQILQEKRIKKVDPISIVTALNQQLNQFSYDIANSFKRSFDK